MRQLFPNQARPQALDLFQKRVDRLVEGCGRIPLAPASSVVNEQRYDVHAPVDGFHQLQLRVRRSGP